MRNKIIRARRSGRAWHRGDDDGNALAFGHGGGGGGGHGGGFGGGHFGGGFVADI